MATKLFVPPPRDDAVPRPRLNARINDGLRRKLTLLAAPAGFGKTTALSAWRADEGARGMPFGWVSLDGGDNDPTRFWSYVCLALDGARTGVGQPALAVLREPRSPPIEAILTLLLNGLAAVPDDLALVLDDYHVIEAPPIHEALVFLLDHLPPHLHLLISSRADPPLPLARLRARGELVELRAVDLRFTLEEASGLLTNGQGFSLAAADIAALTAQTEGWIAGLQLAALSLRGRDDVAHFVRDFTGSHRFLLDYLAEEVLGRQPAEVQHFLLATAVLDRLCGPLCDALTGGDDGQAMLERLERANLFVIPLDDGRRWYRYHHLFADFLRARLKALGPERMTDLHGRAAAWYEGAGLVADAVGHALAGKDFERAARLMAQVAEPMWMRGELTTLLGWLAALPREAVQARPRLALTHAGAHFLARPYDTDAVGALLAEAEESLARAPATGDEQAELRGILTAIRAARATTVLDVPGAIAFARRALAALPADRVFWRIMATISLGLAEDANGEPAAGHTLSEARTLSLGSGHRYLALVATMNLARVRAAHGELHQAADLCRQGLALAAEQAGGGGRLPVVGYCHVQLGKLLYEWNDLAGAEREFREGVAQVWQADEQLRVLIDGYTELARLRIAAGDPNGAGELLRHCDQAVAESRLPWAKSRAAVQRARLDVNRGHLSAAVHWAEEAGLQPEDEATYPRAFALLTLARILLAQDEPAAALDLLARLRAAAATAGRAPEVIEIDILQALTQDAQGNEAGALTSVASALALAEPEGYVRLFVDEGPPLATLLARLRSASGARRSAARSRARRRYIDHLLTSFASPRAAREQAQPLPEALTPRESEVLRLMADGLANPEIADRLFIGVGTVKTYVNGIFGKLGASSRTQAVARARSLGLLVDVEPRP